MSAGGHLGSSLLCQRLVSTPTCVSWSGKLCSQQPAGPSSTCPFPAVASPLEEGIPCLADPWRNTHRSQRQLRSTMMSSTAAHLLCQIAARPFLVRCRRDDRSVLCHLIWQPCHWGSGGDPLFLSWAPNQAHSADAQFYTQPGGWTVLMLPLNHEPTQPNRVAQTNVSSATEVFQKLH